MNYISLPLQFLEFWFIEAPKGMAAYFNSLNGAFVQLFSLSLLVQTFFRPWKNEYRKGYVGVAVGISVVIKTFVILADLALFFLLLLAEFLVILIFLALPFLTIYILFR